MSLADLYRKLIPQKIRASLHIGVLWNKILESYHIIMICYIQKRALRKLKKKDQIKCVFLGLFSEVWKYDDIYKIMESHPRFDPMIVVCPIVNYGFDNMLHRMDDCYDYFKQKGYHVIKSYDCQKQKYIDLQKDVRPDIIFYTNPYKGLIDDRYFITEFPNILTVYVPYYFNEGVSYKIAYDTLFQNLLWRRYVETDFHKKISETYGRNHGRNSVVVGYPGIEKFIKPTIKVNDDCWKIKSKKLKRIIWAPHHTIQAVGNCHYSCFLQYSDVMINLAQKYKNEVQFVFRPHPLLRNRLDLLWGKEKTDAYYDLWENMSNTSIKGGDYTDMFMTSDAMIHDSGSFLIEYLYVNKPVMRTLNDIPLESMYNQFALKCLDHYYKAYNEQDIEQFIQNLINGVDPLKEQRTKFVNEVLIPKGSPSQNIIDDILDSIDNQILYRN